MDPSLRDLWSALTAWTETHPHATSVLQAVVVFVVGLFAARILARSAAKLVLQRLFGDQFERIQLPSESVRQAAQAQAAAAAAIVTHQRMLAADIEAMHARVRTELSDTENDMRNEVGGILDAVRDHQVPLTLVVRTPEDRQMLEALIARSAPRVVVRTGRARPNNNRPQADEVPTAWTRFLTDEDEEGTPCPAPTAATTTPPEPNPTPVPSKPKKKSTRAKKAKG